jgi:uncharacterized surface protein with fasciclin (FAS1) repeats
MKACFAISVWILLWLGPHAIGAKPAQSLRSRKVLSNDNKRRKNKPLGQDVTFEELLRENGQFEVLLEVAAMSLPPTHAPTNTTPLEPTRIPKGSPTKNPSGAPTQAPIVPANTPMLNLSFSPVAAETPVRTSKSPTSVPTDIGDPTLQPTIGSIPPIEIPTGAPLQSIAFFIANTPRFSILEEALVAANLLDTFSRDIQLTVFAPNDAAFETLDLVFLEALLTNPGFGLHLFQLLTYHGILGSFPSASLTSGRELASLLDGSDLTVSIISGSIFLNTTAVVSGVSGAFPSRLIETNVQVSNGILHEMEMVLLPNFAFFYIFDVLQQGVATFSTLSSLIIQADLEQILQENEMTVLAPNNDAFAMLPSQTFAFLQNPTNVDTLRQVLTYHLSTDVFISLQLIDTDILNTLEGSTVAVTAIFDPESAMLVNLFFNFVGGVRFNVLAANGIVHEINGLLVPPNASVPGVGMFSMQAVTEYLEILASANHT